MNPEQTLVLVCGTGLLLCAATVYLAGVILGEWPRPFLRTVGAEADPWPTTLSQMTGGPAAGSNPNINGWTVGTLHEHVTALLEEHDKRMNERELRTEERFREKDLRDQQRFDAGQKALIDALVAQEKLVTAALNANNTAVGKAESDARAQFALIRESQAILADKFSASEGAGRGTATAQTTRQAGNSYLVALGAVAVALASLLLAILNSGGHVSP